MRRPALFVGLMLIGFASSAAAQRLAQPWVPGPAAVRTSASLTHSLRLDSAATVTPASRAFAALLGGTIGFVGGGVIGYHLDSRGRQSDDPGFVGAAWGAVLGEGLGMVAAATLASPSQSRSYDWLAVPAIAVAGVALVAVTNHAELLLLIPAVQMIELLSGRPEPGVDAAPDGPPPL